MLKLQVKLPGFYKDLTDRQMYRKLRDACKEHMLPESFAEKMIPCVMEYVHTGYMTPVLLAGSPGCGKTTAAKILAEIMSLDYTLISAPAADTNHGLGGDASSFVGADIGMIARSQLDHQRLNPIKDTSRGGTYHNKRFKEECEKRDLIISYHSRIGYSLTKPGPVLYDLVEEYGWKEKIRLFRTGKKISSSKGGDSESGHTGTDGSEPNGKKKSSTRKYVCPKCRMSIRATKVVRVACIDCNNTQMVLG